jgi:integrase
LSELQVNENELLCYALENGIIDMEAIQKQFTMNERKKYLEMHNEHYKTWLGSDGQYYTYLPDDTKKEKRKKVKRNSSKDLDDAIISYYKSKENEPLVGAVFQAWITEKLEYGEISKQSYDKYQNNYKRFFQNEFYPLHDCKIRYVTEDILEKFIKTAISKLELSQKAYSDMRILINGIFKYAKKKHYTTISITQFMGDLQISKNMFVRKVVRKEDEVFLEDEIPRIMEYLEQQNDIHSLGLLLAFQTGVRCGELSALKLSDIHTKQFQDSDTLKHYISIERTEVKLRDENGKWKNIIQDYPKTDAGIRNIIVTDKTTNLISKIREINPFGEYLFMYEGKRIRGHAFNKKLGRVCKTLNINKRTMHKIRKTYGTTLIDNNVDDALICEMMGHKDINTTKKYYYYSNKSEKTKVEQINNALASL